MFNKKKQPIIRAPVFWNLNQQSFFVPDSDLFLGVVSCTCNPVNLEAEFRNGVGSIPVGGNSL